MSTIPNQSETRWAFVAEQTAAVTPATPAFQIARPRAGSTLKINRPRQESTEMRPDRQLGSTFGGIGGGSGQLQTLLFHETFQHALLEMAACGTWATNSLDVGLVENYKTFERRFLSGNGVICDRLLGALANSMALSVIPNQEVTVDYGLMSFDGEVDDAEIAGSTYAAAGVTEPADYAQVSDITLFGLSGFSLLRLDLGIANNLGGQPALGQRGLKGIRMGKSRVSGSVQVYLEDPAYYTAALANTVGEVAFTIGTGAGSRYTFTMPRAEISDNGADDSSGDGVLTIPFTAKIGGSGESQLNIARNV